MRIRGRYHDGNQAAGSDVEVELGDDGFLYSDHAEPVPLSRIEISSRVGNIPRRLLLPGGGAIETQANDELDTWIRSHGGKPGLLHSLESNLKIALGAVAGVALIFTVFMVWGIPWLSTRAAYAIPAEVNNYIGRGTLETLDRRVFKSTTLDQDRRRGLAARFSQLVPPQDEAIRFTLEFRGGGLIGANALALPGGTVVITDELISLARDDDEIMSVLLHEIGHVVNRHSLRQVLSHSGLLVMTSVITGDINSAGALVLTMPNVIADITYTRDLEYEADTYSLEHLPSFNIPATKFADFMQRLEDCAPHLHRGEGEAEVVGPVTWQQCEAMADGEPGQRQEGSGWVNYVSTHPPTADRISRFRQSGQ